MIRGVVIENFRNWQGRHVIPLAPLTLVYGPNSAGKSSLLDAVELISALLSGKHTRAPELGASADNERLGRFERIVSRSRVEDRVTVGLQWDAPSSARSPFGTRDLTRGIEIQICSYEPATGGGIVDCLTYSFGHHRIELRRAGGDELGLSYLSPGIRTWLLERLVPAPCEPPTSIDLVTESGPATEPNGHALLALLCMDLTVAHLQSGAPSLLADGATAQWASEDSVVSAIWRIGNIDDGNVLDHLAFVPDWREIRERLGLQGDDDDAEHDKPIYDLAKALLRAGTSPTHARLRQEWSHATTGLTVELECLLQSITQIGPLRVPIPQATILKGGACNSVGHRGENTVELLKQPHIASAASAILRQITGGETRGYSVELRNWVPMLRDAYDAGSNVRAPDQRMKTAGSVVSVVLTDHASKAQVSVAEVGFGISQMMPIIVQIVGRTKGIVFIQQPELHLNPNLQKHFFQFMIDAVDSAISNGPEPLQVVIETHSEVAFHRLNRLTAHGQLEQPEAFSVLYVARATGQWEESMDEVQACAERADSPDTSVSRGSQLAKRVGSEPEQSARAKVYKLRLASAEHDADGWPDPDFLGDEFDEVTAGKVVDGGRFVTLLRTGGSRGTSRH